MSKLKIALAGNPNSGKTTLFNRLTGSHQYVGNWPGVTVEKKEGKVKNSELILQDLPGIYSLSPYSLEEEIAREFLIHGDADVILNIVDASNLQRNLYLTTQLLEIDLPMLVVLNMMDVVEKRGEVIDTQALSEKLGCPVLPISALKGEGVDEVLSCINNLSERIPIRIYGEDLAEGLDEIQQIIGEKKDNYWHAIKLFERDEKVREALDLSEDNKSKIERLIKVFEEKCDDDSGSIITGERYRFIHEIMGTVLIKKAKSNHMSTSDRIDKVVTHRIFALPIFVLVMFTVYFVAIHLGLKTQDMVDADLFGEIIIPHVEGVLESASVSGWLISLICDGMIAGVGAVLSFVPQMLILFFFLAILEDCGYMARVAFIMDKAFRRFGLSGKSFIPMLVGSGCSVPGIMASRTISDERERKMTIITTSFIPCGAKLPVIAMVVGTVFGGVWWMAPLSYFVGVIAVITSGLMLKKTSMFAGEPSPFLLELPPYHLPMPSNVFKSMWERGWSFIKRAGTVILLSSIFIWFTTSFGFVDGQFTMLGEEIDQSILAKLGGAFAPIFRPLGFGNWQAVSATVLGLVAKEEVVSFFGVISGITGDALELAEEAQYSELAPILANFTQLSAFSFLLFNLLCPPCFAAIGAIKREMNSPKWTAFTIVYMLGFAYVTSFIFYQLALFFSGNSFNILTGFAIALFAAVMFQILRPVKVLKKELAYAAS